MKVYFATVKSSDPGGVSFSGGTLQFTVTKPVVIQPSEIMKVPINSVVKVDPGVVLNISTHPDLAVKVGELFPSLVVLDSSSPEVPLELPVRNAGRNPINLMPGNPVAVGHLVPTENIELEEFSIAVATKDRPKSSPPKRNKEIKFEVKN